jgi:hypothetical protein
VFQHRAPGLFLLAALSCGVGAGFVRANLVVNGGFETGNFTGWTLTNGQYTYVTSGDPYDGTYDYFNGEYPPGSTLSQTVDTTVGDWYILTFWLAESSYGDAPGYSFTVATDASATPLLVLLNTADFDYTLFTEEFQATNITTTISFSGYNLPGGTNMDDVSLVDAAPEPDTWGSVALGGVALFVFRPRRPLARSRAAT